MADLTLVDLYGNVCDELALSEGERRRFWFAIASEVEHVAVALANPDDVTPAEIAGVCDRLGVPSIRELAARARRPAAAGGRVPAATHAPFPADPAEVLALHWTMIEEIVAQTRYKLRADGEEADTVESRIKEKLFENDCEIVRNFRHESSFRSYLTVIIQRAFADLQVERYGKWHFSALSERLGPLAKELERLMYREGYAASDAVSALLTSHPEISRAQLETLLEELPAKHRRPTKVSIDDAGDSLPASDPDVLLMTGEHFMTSGKIRAVLQSFMESLADDDRLLLQLIFESNLKVSAIARRLKRDQKALYRRRDQLFAELRKQLLKQGIGRSEATSLYEYVSDKLPSRSGKRRQ